ncbi:hypothetical protein ACFL2Q_18325, partial [Thermodesulfobacteriota bacterium]
AHAEFTNFWDTLSSFARGEDSFKGRTDLALGVGCRHMFGPDVLVGLNAFYGTAKLGGQWYSSGSAGLEMAWLLSGNSALDLNFNWYGNLVSAGVWRNAFRNGPSVFDVEAGYSQKLWTGGPDLRLNLTGYSYGNGPTTVYGWNGGAEITSADGVCSILYETGADKTNATYHTVGGTIRIGLQLENLLRGGNPFQMPEPIFRGGARNLEHWHARKVRRKFHPTAGHLLSRVGSCWCCIPQGFPIFTESLSVTVAPNTWGTFEKSNGSTTIHMRENQGNIFVDDLIWNPSGTPCGGWAEIIIWNNSQHDATNTRFRIGFYDYCSDALVWLTPPSPPQFVQARRWSSVGMEIRDQSPLIFNARCNGIDKLRVQIQHEGSNPVEFLMEGSQALCRVFLNSTHSCCGE